MSASSSLLRWHLWKKPPQEERRRVLEVLTTLCENPVVDGITKFYFDAPPLVLTLYADTGLWIVYYTSQQATLSVVNIGRSGERPDIRR